MDGRSFKISGQPRFAADGAFLGYRGVGCDVTAERETQERLAATHAALQKINRELARHNLRFDTALNNMTHGLCMFDGERRLIVCNTRYAEMYGLTPISPSPARATTIFSPIGSRPASTRRAAPSNTPPT